jgi:hypothetical protein
VLIDAPCACLLPLRAPFRVRGCCRPLPTRPAPCRSATPDASARASDGCGGGAANAAYALRMRWAAPLMGRPLVTIRWAATPFPPTPPPPPPALPPFLRRFVAQAGYDRAPSSPRFRAASLPPLTLARAAHTSELRELCEVLGLDDRTCVDKVRIREQSSECGT